MIRFFLLTTFVFSDGERAIERMDLGVHGLELAVPDVEKAERFYVEAFGFVRAETSSTASAVCLQLGPASLFLRRSDASTSQPGSASISLNLRVRDLERALVRAELAGALIEDPEPRKIPIGSSIEIRDPFSHPIHLIDVDGDEPQADVAVYNLGIDVTSWDAEASFVQLGFEVFSRDYLPLALPFELRGDVPLVLHARASSPVDPLARGQTLVFSTSDLDRSRELLAGLGFIRSEATSRLTGGGRSLVFRGPSGLSLRVLERSSPQVAFERLKSLAGTWEGKSTLGWTSRTRYEAIAGGTVLLETEDFDAHRGEAMATAYHLDGSELALTHYCIAGNQPRLVATEIEGERIVFEFAGGANIVSRDQGHMDRAVFEFQGPDAFTSTWSWYQNGAFAWSETIEYRRQPESPRH